MIDLGYVLAGGLGFLTGFTVGAYWKPVPESGVVLNRARRLLLPALLVLMAFFTVWEVGVAQRERARIVACVARFSIATAEVLEERAQIAREDNEALSRAFVQQNRGVSVILAARSRDETARGVEQFRSALTTYLEERRRLDEESRQTSFPEERCGEVPEP